MFGDVTLRINQRCSRLKRAKKNDIYEGERLLRLVFSMKLKLIMCLSTNECKKLNIF